MKFKLSKYIIPSVVSMVLVGTYSNIDGFFIGNVIGDDGLAAINIVWPIVALITALGTGLGVGGSVLLNRFRGEENHAAAEDTKTTLLFLLLTVGILSGGILFFCYKPLLSLMGAEGAVFDYAAEYAKIIVLGAVFQIMGSGAVVLLRNEHKTVFSMLCCVVGVVMHILLDWLLVDKYKLGGVAISTVASQAAIMVMSAFVIKIGKGSHITPKHILPILGCSTSPIGINFVPSVVLLLTNLFALKAGGNAAVSAYAVMSYAVYTFDYIFQGVCDGIQPALSYYTGANDEDGKKQALKTGGLVMAGCVVVFMASTPLLMYGMPKLFAVSDTACGYMQMGFLIYMAAYPFKAAVKFICSYLYSCGKTKLSNLLIYLDPLVLTPIFLFALTKFFGVNGLWLSLPCAQLCLTAIAAVKLRTNKKKEVL